jgi:hypothetical protein
VVTDRLWLVMFGDTPRRAWWANLLRPEFRHVWAVSWYADQERWVEFNPARTGTIIRLWTADQFPAVLTVLLRDSAAVLRVASRTDRWNASASAYCVGAVKSLLGIRSPALTPYGLYRDLLARGAEQVQVKGACVAAPREAAASSAP